MHLVPHPRPTGPSDALFIDVTVFDGRTRTPHCTVLVRDGIIQDLHADPATPHVPRIENGSATLLPGLIDAHAHLWAEGATSQAAVFGVTTVLDMFSPTHLADQWARPVGGIGPVAGVLTAGLPATAPGGHGTEYGIGTVPLTGPTDADAFVTQQLADGATYIKIICDTLHGPAHSLTPATVAALVTAAHQHGVLAVAHTTRTADPAVALDAGADALMHIPVDDITPLLSRPPAVLVPTLTTLHAGLTDAEPDALTDRRLRSLLDLDAIDNLRQRWSIRARWTYQQVRANLYAAHQAGWPILAGTDAGMPTTAHGASLHTELALLVEAGLTPAQALTAATAEPALVFGLEDRGRIAPGLRADLLLVHGDPTRTITDTRNLLGVWIAGQRVDHAQWHHHLDTERTRLTARTIPAPTDSQLVAPGTPIDANWHPHTDYERGGTSRAQINPDTPGLRFETTVIPHGGFPFAYAGARYTFTPQPGQSDDGIDLTSATALYVTARADTPTHLLISFDAGYRLKAPQTIPIDLTGHDQHHRIPLTAFTTTDLTRVRAISLTIARPGLTTVHITHAHLS